MTATLPAPRTTAWYDRRGARWGALGVLTVGLLLVAVGVFGLVSAKQTNDDAAPTKAQLTSMQTELATLTQQRDDAVAAAQTARARGNASDAALEEVDFQLLQVEDQTVTVSNAAGAIADCDAQSTNAARLACSQSALSAYRTQLDLLAKNITALKAATTQLEEATQ